MKKNDSKVFFLVFAFILCNFSISAHLFPHIIWMYWDNGIQSMGKFQRSCVEVVKKLHEETDWQLRFIDQNSIQIWFSPQQYLELAQFLDPKFQVTKQTRANFIRYFLLRQHGGVWLDVSIILHQNLNWLDDLKNNPRVFNRQMSQNPEVFMFVICVSQKEKGSIIHNGKLIYPRLYMENSMIAAVKKSQFIIDLINQYKIIIKQTKAQYDQTMLKLNVPYHYDPYFRAYLSEVVTVYRKFYNYYSASEQQKKTFQFYKLWGLQRQYGLYHKLDKRSFYFFFQSEYFRGDHGHYMSKINHFGFQQMIQTILNGTQFDVYNVSKFVYSKSYQYGLSNVKKQYSCLYQARIYQDSVLNKYLLSRINTQEVFPNLTVKKNSELPFICRTTNLKQILDYFLIIYQWVKYAIKIIFIIEFIVQYSAYIFKLRKTFLNGQNFNMKKQNWKHRIFTIVFFVHFMYFQVNSIKIQTQLWYQGNPLAWKTLVIEFFLLVVLVRNILEMSVFSYKRQIKFSIFYKNFGFILIVKYLSWYFFAIWQYQGPIFGYRLTSDHNLLQLLQMQKNILKIIVLIATYLLIISAKSIFNLYVTENKQKLMLISKEGKQKYEDEIPERYQNQYLKIKEKDVGLNGLEEEAF